MSNLRFLRTESVEEFKAQHGINRLEILENKNSGKHFFVWSGGKGAVAENFSLSKEPLVSLVQGDDNEPFLLLHNRGGRIQLFGTL